MKFFYFFAVEVMRFLVLVGEKIVFSFNYNFIWIIVHTIYFRYLDICLLQMNCMLEFF